MKKKKKTLDTLVSDIYDKLSVLGEGGSLDIKEKDIDKFGESMKDILRKWSNPEPRSNERLRMSNIGRPLRQLWFDVKSDKEPEKIPPSVFIKFLYGHLLEEIVLFLVKMSGHEVTDEQKSVEVDGIKGHMDCVIDGEVVDVKTTLPEDDVFGYMAQLTGYEAAQGTKNGAFLALNKESGELALFKPDNFDKQSPRFLL
jgi:hypothetical protein